MINRAASWRKAGLFATGTRRRHGKKKKKKKIPTKIPTITLVRIDATPSLAPRRGIIIIVVISIIIIIVPAGGSFSSLKVRVKGGDVWDAFAL